LIENTEGVRRLKIKEIKSKKSVEQSTARTAAAKANAQNLTEFN